MKGRITALAVAAGLALGGGAVVSAPAIAGAAPQAHLAKTCKRGTPARIGGETKCLQRGEYCATRYQKQYRSHGFVCRGGRLR